MMLFLNGKCFLPIFCFNGFFQSLHLGFVFLFLRRNFFIFLLLSLHNVFFQVFFLLVFDFQILMEFFLLVFQGVHLKQEGLITVFVTQNFFLELFYHSGMDIVNSLDLVFMIVLYLKRNVGLKSIPNLQPVISR